VNGRDTGVACDTGGWVVSGGELDCAADLVLSCLAVAIAVDDRYLG
jgi:hypothetical protein